MRHPGEGFHREYAAADAIGLTKAERTEERLARGEPVDGRARKRGSAPVTPPFDEMLRTIGILEWVKPICREHGVLVNELPCGTKASRVMAVRRFVWTELRARQWSYEQIALLFGYAGHTPVLDALNGGNKRGERAHPKTERRKA
jgi:hypothetical protein